MLDFVRRGSKRATAGAVADLATEYDRPPQVGQYWGLLDGAGRPQFVMQTTELRTGRLDSVDPAFAWDEGEYDRTRESWLDGHRRFFARQGVADPDGLDTVFERFRIVWPEPDTTVWLTDHAREIDLAERDWAGEIAGEDDGRRLPALVAESDGQRRGLLTFCPRPGGETEIRSVHALADGAEALLLDGVAALARRSGWLRVRGAGHDVV